MGFYICLNQNYLHYRSPLETRGDSRASARAGKGISSRFGQQQSWAGWEAQLFCRRITRLEGATILFHLTHLAGSQAQLYFCNEVKVQLSLCIGQRDAAIFLHEDLNWLLSHAVNVTEATDTKEIKWLTSYRHMHQACWASAIQVLALCRKGIHL